MFFMQPPVQHKRIARAFYCDVLQGRQVWTDAPESGANMAFIVEGTRIDVDTNSPVEGAPVVLAVCSPTAVAERCWDAGYSVHVADVATGGAAVSVIDPFGRRIDLVP